jgi:nucleoside diphosphate kinase
MKESLDKTIPQICDYFGTSSFKTIAKELRKYDRNVEEHYASFLETQKIWAKIVNFIKD